MKVLILLLFSISLFAENLPVMLKIKTDLKLNEGVIAILRAGVEDVLTLNGYSLISREQQREALKEQAKQQSSDCYDESCLVTTGRMLAARMLFILKISKLGEEHIFKVEMIDLESGAVEKTFTKIYKGSLKSADDLLKFSKNLTADIIDGNGEIRKVKEYYFLNLKTLPPGADVFINDKKIGVTPLKLKLLKGDYEISFFKNNFKKINLKKHLDRNLSVYERMELDCNKNNTDFCYNEALKLLDKGKNKKGTALLKKICSLDGNTACEKLKQIKEEAEKKREMLKRLYIRQEKEKLIEDRIEGENYLSPVMVIGKTLMFGVELFNSRYKYLNFGLGEIYLNPEITIFGINVFSVGIRLFHDSSYRHNINLNLWLGAEFCDIYEALFPLELSYTYRYNKKIYLKAGIAGFFFYHEKEKDALEYGDTETLSKYELFFKLGLF